MEFRVVVIHDLQLVVVLLLDLLSHEQRNGAPLAHQGYEVPLLIQLVLQHDFCHHCKRGFDVDAFEVNCRRLTE